jgi:dicarboxylate transporter 10
MEIFIVDYSRMQTLDVIASSKRPSTFAVISTSISQSGFRSLYAGLSASLMRQMSYSMVRLGVYEKMKSQLSKDGPPSNVNLLLAAIIAGGLGGIAGNPAGTTILMLFVQFTNDLQHWLRYRIGSNDQ